MRTTTTLLLAIVLLASCNQYEKSPSGLAYKITSSGSSKEKLKNGQFVKFNVEYKLPPKDSTLTSSYGHIPAYMVIDTSRPAKHSFLEIITQCAVGDKIEFVMSVDTLKNLGMIEYNNIFHAKDMIKGRVEILKTFATQEEAQADVMKEQELETQRELKDLKDFTAKKGIKTQTTKSGALVEIINAGDAVKGDSGMMVKVMYRGSLLDGTEFDANMDKNNKPTNQALMVLAGSTGGQNSVIKGMDEALRFFGKGGKGKILIPAMLGYGQSGNPPLIPAYASLVFDVEIIDVTVPAATPSAPAMPGQPQAGPGNR